MSTLLRIATVAADEKKQIVKLVVCKSNTDEVQALLLKLNISFDSKALQDARFDQIVIGGERVVCVVPMHQYTVHQLERLCRGFEIRVVVCAEKPFSLADKANLLAKGASDVVHIENLAYAIRCQTDELSTVDDEQFQLRNFIDANGLIGNSLSWVRAMREVRCIVPYPTLPVMICGESGTGKELVARAIHREGVHERQGMFVPINCSLLGESTASSQIFGHIKGAFTGAYINKEGLLAKAKNGTLLFDDFQNLMPSVQNMILRVIQERKYSQMGSMVENDASSVRFVFASNKPIANMVDQGEMQRDLFYRICPWRINLPTLKERRDDIELLTNHFLLKHRKSKEHVQDIAPDVVEAFRNLPWPGNTRELENVIFTSLIKQKGAKTLRMSDLPYDVLIKIADLAPES